MISVVIPTLNAAVALRRTLAALVPAAIEGLVGEVLVVDGGSQDNTCELADAAGARVLIDAGGRGPQLAAGAAAARHPWLLFLHADTELEAGWEKDARCFIEGVEQGLRREAAAAFRFALDDRRRRARVLERLVAARCAVLRLPYGDQGLLISQQRYRASGGFRPLPLMEDVDFVRRLGRSQIAMLGARAVTSAERYRRDGFVRRSLRNLACLLLYAIAIPPRLIQRLYG
jgi:rSAM/selenodomain-associated transferase 2